MEQKWEQIYTRLMNASLLARRDVKQQLLEHPNINLLISKLESKGVKGILSPQLLDEVTREINNEAQSSNIKIGRTIAPINPPKISPASRPHGLEHYDLSLFETNASDIDVDLEVLFEITGNSITEGRKEDIHSFFNNRFQRISAMIRQQGLPNRPISISKLVQERRSRSGYSTSTTIIGMVNDPKHTKNGHFMFVIEDDGAQIDCICYKEQDNPNPIIKTGLMQDDVIAITGAFVDDNDIFRVDEFHRPPLKRHNKKSSEAGISVAFISDIHVGSKTFLEAQWIKMVDWFHKDPLAKTIKYLILSGDVVDGVGIYPNQDKELAIKDLFKQYSRFAELLELLPEWVECVLLPGNHDAVRPAEPQPALEPEIQADFNSTTFVGNPCSFRLHGVDLLSYHGKSIDDFVSMPEVSYAHPVEAMKEMLRRRHLAPTWGKKTPLSPEPEDNLIIGEIPDIFVTGHVHGHNCSDFKGTTLVCSSTWQDQTAYQRMLGFQPQPCILTVVNLKTHASASIPFA
jgi:DNA polymerase II small subunit